jgi:2-polyprenyl-6-hydroxyphenyl methylase/3-demethylubiquinone-9 3-methyltransferase
MAIMIDPQEREMRALGRLAHWNGRRVLEIGCGDGRLTRRLARLGARVQAIDPDPKQIRVARALLTGFRRELIEYRVGRVERLRYRAHEFDSVVFSWAL